MDKNNFQRIKDLKQSVENTNFSAKERLRKIVSKRLTTCFICGVSNLENLVEDIYKLLEANNLNEDTIETAFERYRKAVLDMGNGQIRLLNRDFDGFDIKDLK